MTSIVTETRTIIQSIFSLPELWQTVYPIHEDAAVLAPSSKGSRNCIYSEFGCGNELFLKTIKKKLLEVHFSQPISDTFWTTMADHVMRAISGPLTSYILMETSNEATVRSFLIEPVIRELASHLSHLPVQPPDKCTLFTASVSIEHALPLHEGPGRPASVDFCIVLRQDNNIVISCVPGEAKIVVSEKDVKQLSLYMWKIGTSDVYKKRCVVGFLMDHHSFRIAFTPLVYGDSKTVPISYVSPPITWRNITLSPSAVVRSSLLILSCVVLANIPAIEVGPEFTHLRSIAEKLYESQLFLNPPRSLTRADYTGLIMNLQEMKSEIEKLKAEDEKLRAEDEKLRAEDAKLREEDAKQKRLIRQLEEADHQQRMTLHFLQGLLSDLPSAPGTPGSGRAASRDQTPLRTPVIPQRTPVIGVPPYKRARRHSDSYSEH